MKRAVSISLGSSKRDSQVEIDILGETVRLERRGADGDAAKAQQWFSELDGQVDAFGLGGINLWIQADRKQYALAAGHKLVKNVRHTPVVDGGGLKNTLERMVVHALIERLGDRYAAGRVLLPVAIDRYGMTQAFLEQTYDLVFGDLMFVLGLPLPLRSYRSFKWMARLLAPPIARLPARYLYPTGTAQDKIVPRFETYYQWASVIAGDCQYIKQHMPPDLSGKVIVTNTTTAADRRLFQERGVSYLVTTTPIIDGRSFGTNALEAALTAATGNKRPLTADELNTLIHQLGLQPTVHAL